MEIQLLRKKIVKSQEVVLLAGDTNYTKVYLNDGSVFHLAKTLKLLSKDFNESNEFFRSHKSYIINLNCINEIFNFEILMNNQQKVLLSRRKRDTIRMMMQL